MKGLNPKYKIGDVVLYTTNDSQVIYQSRIVLAQTTVGPKKIWVYQVSNPSLDEPFYSIAEGDIIKKL